MTEPNIPLPALCREEATRLGLMTYLGPKPCLRGHNPTIRYTKGAQCILCVGITTSSWRAANPGRKTELDREYHANPENKARAYRQAAERRAADPEKRREYERAYYAQNPHLQKERTTKWAGANPTAVCVRQSRRRARKRGAEGNHTKEDVADILKLQKGKCAYCRTKLSAKFDIDHIVPLYLGGSNARTNLQIACVPCNRSKSAKHPIDFARQKFGLLL